MTSNSIFFPTFFLNVKQTPFTDTLAPPIKPFWNFSDVLILKLKKPLCFDIFETCPCSETMPVNIYAPHSDL